MTVEQLGAMLQAISEAITAEHERLNQLDAALGDGDHGSSLSAAFMKAIEQQHDLDNPTPSDLLRSAAMALMNTMGGASGALYGTMFLQASAAVQGRMTLDVADMSAMWRAGLDGVMQRGQAEPGGKTMLDALQSAVEALQAAADQSLPLADALDMAADAAHEGAEATKHMIARFGRAKFTGERSLGSIDAGAASTAVMFQAMRDYWKGNQNAES